MRAHTQTYVTDFAVPVDERTEGLAVQGFGSSGAEPQSLIEPSAVGYKPTGKPDGLPPSRWNPKDSRGLVALAASSRCRASIFD